jgi:hypothetical protein
MPSFPCPAMESYGSVAGHCFSDGYMKLINNQFYVSDGHNYLIAGNLCNAFVLGEVGSADDFFLVGADPGPHETSYPLLTGNILDSEGDVLFRLVRNILVLNPGHCSKMVGDHIGYEIHDTNDNLIFKVETIYTPPANHPDSKLITTLKANFYNKNKELVFAANSGEEDERIEALCKCRFGFSHGCFGPRFGPPPVPHEELVAAAALAGGGFVHEVASGDFEGVDFTLDGKILIDIHIRNCKIHVHSGNWEILPSARVEHNVFVFHDQAKKIADLAMRLEARS